VQTLKWYQLLKVFDSAPDSVSSFALDRWKAVGPFDVRSFIRDNKIKVADKNTGVVQKTISFGADTKAVYSGQPLNASLPVGRTVSKGEVFEG